MASKVLGTLLVLLVVVAQVPFLLGARQSGDLTLVAYSGTVSLMSVISVGVLVLLWKGD